MSVSYLLVALWLMTNLLLSAGANTPLPCFMSGESTRQGKASVLQTQDAASGRTICIDPGHSRATVGASGRHGVEYKIAWRMALRLKTALEKDGVTVVLTKRNVDENVRNEDRAAIANRAHAALFLRLHCDAASDSGIATYFPDRPGVKDGVRGPDTEVIAASRKAAYRFHTAMITALSGRLRDRGVHTDMQTNVGGHQGALTGSIFARVPVLLVEMCVITNPKDDAFITSEDGQRALTWALEQGALAVLAASRTGQRSE